MHGFAGAGCQGEFLTQTREYLSSMAKERQESKAEKLPGEGSVRNVGCKGDFCAMGAKQEQRLLSEDHTYRPPFGRLIGTVHQDSGLARHAARYR